MPVITQRADIRLQKADVIDEGAPDSQRSTEEGPREYAARQRLREHLQAMREHEGKAGRPLSGTHPLTKERDRLLGVLKGERGK